MQALKFFQDQSLDLNPRESALILGQNRWLFSVPPCLRGRAMDALSGWFNSLTETGGGEIFFLVQSRHWLSLVLSFTLFCLYRPTRGFHECALFAFCSDRHARALRLVNQFRASPSTRPGAAIHQ
jgi:hypothetical protein